MAYDIKQLRDSDTYFVYFIATNKRVWLNGKPMVPCAYGVCEIIMAQYQAEYELEMA